ncbi:14011_t:CDS:2, partial [Gigaspora rosea]
SKANTMKEIRRTAESNPTLKDAFTESVQQPIRLIRSIFERQSLKDIPFQIFDAATENEIMELWNTIHLIDDNISQQDRISESITKIGSKTLHGWYIHSIPYEMSIKKFFEKLIIGEISPESNINIDSFETIESVELSQSIGSIAIRASFDCEIIKITKTIGINIHYHLKSNNPTTSHLVFSPNALDILMQNSRKMQIHLQ